MNTTRFEDCKTALFVLMLEMSEAKAEEVTSVQKDFFLSAKIVFNEIATKERYKNEN